MPVQLTSTDKSIEISDSRPIGIFDSGVGGLSIAKCITQQLPNENFIYLADNLHAPYGNKSTKFIVERVNTIAQTLVKKNIKALVIACNTATVNAIDQLRQQLSIPIIGVEPAIKPAALYSKNKNIAILVTQATANNARFLNLVQRFSMGANVIIQPCPGLVELIEQGNIDSADCHNLLLNYLLPLKDQQIDTIVLGCTHYPFLIEKINHIIGHQIKIIDTAAPVTKELSHQLMRHKLYAPKNNTSNQAFYSSKNNNFVSDIFNDLWRDNTNKHLQSPIIVQHL